MWAQTSVSVTVTASKGKCVWQCRFWPQFWISLVEVCTTTMQSWFIFLTQLRIIFYRGSQQRRFYSTTPLFTRSPRTGSFSFQSSRGRLVFWSRGNDTYSVMSWWFTGTVKLQMTRQVNWISICIQILPKHQKPGKKAKQNRNT